MKQAPWSFVEKYYVDNLDTSDPETKWYLSFFKNIKGKNILSLGCGPNLYDDVSLFGEIPKELVGIDLNKSNLEFMKKSKHPELIKCKKFILKKKVKVELINGDILKIRKDFINHFDSIYACGVIGIFNEKKLVNLLNILHKYLKSKGIFLAVDWRDHQLTKEKYIERRSYNWYYEEGPSIKKIGKLMKKSGFKILKYDIYNIPDKKEYGWGKIYIYLIQKI